MKTEVIVINYQDLFDAVAEISEKNELYTVDDLCEHLEQNPDMAYQITKITKG